MAISFSTDTEQILSDVDEMSENAKKAVNYTVKDIKSRGPGWIASETVKEYNIKRSEITPARSRSSKKAVSVSTSGDTMESLEIVYKGRTLTPLHFSMTPKKPTGKRDQKQVVPGSGIKFKGTQGAYATIAVHRPYSIRMQIKKGQTVELKGRYAGKPFITNARHGNSTMIPFQRIDDGWRDAEAIHTVSVPQMVGNDAVREKITSRLNTEARKRLEHHMERLMK